MHPPQPTALRQGRVWRNQSRPATGLLGCFALSGGSAQPVV